MALMGDQATRDALQDCVRDLGLDRPVVVQYGEFLWKSVRLDFGQSFRQHYRVTDYILRMFPYTFTLVLASMVIALAIGLPTGILSALKRRNPLIDYSVRIIALLGLSMPVFWFGILLLIMFSLRFDLFPLIGGGDMTTVLDMLTSGEFVTYPEDFLLDCCVLAEERRTSSRHDWLLLGEQIAKDIFHPLSELEVLVRIQDHGLHEGLGLLTTRFPNGFDGQAPFPR